LPYLFQFQKKLL